MGNKSMLVLYFEIFRQAVKKPQDLFQGAAQHWQKQMQKQIFCGFSFNFAVSCVVCGVGVWQEEKLCFALFQYEVFHSRQPLLGATAGGALFEPLSSGISLWMSQVKGAFLLPRALTDAGVTVAQFFPFPIKLLASSQSSLHLSALREEGPSLEPKPVCTDSTR